MKLYVIHDGDLPLPEAALVNVDNTFDMNRMATNKEYMEKMMAATIQIPMSSYLIEAEEGTILFDFGNSLHSSIKVPPEQSLLYSLNQLGHKPEDIRYAVCSHLHSDHIGYLKYFTNSKIYIHHDELSVVRHLYDTKTYAESLYYQKEDVEDWFATDLHWIEVSGRFQVQELLPGVDLLILGRGHSYGMLGLMVHLKQGSVILCSDCCYCRKNYEPVITPQATLLDEPAYRETIQYLLNLSKKNHAQLWCGHDAEQFQSLRKYDQGFYE